MAKSIIQTPKEMTPVFTIERAFEIRRQINSDLSYSRQCRGWSQSMKLQAKKEISEKLNQIKDARQWEQLRLLAYTAANTNIQMSGCGSTSLLPTEYIATLNKAIVWSLQYNRPYRQRRSNIFTLSYRVNLDKVWTNRGREYSVRQFMPTLKDWRINELAQGGEIKCKAGLINKMDYSMDQLQQYLPQWLFEAVVEYHDKANHNFITTLNWLPTLKSNVKSIKCYQDLTI